MPVEFVIKCKRINYLHFLLKSDNSSIAKRVFLEQFKTPIKGDFSSLVKKDLLDCQINLTFEEIESFSKVKFKSFVRKSCERASFNKLIHDKSKLSKGKELEYCMSELQQYLTPGSYLSSDDVCNILKCRIRDLDVKGNFPMKYSDKSCPFPDCKATESQYHFATCGYYPHTKVIPNGVHYSDLFESDPLKQYQIMKILMERFATRIKVIEEHTGGTESSVPVDPRRTGRTSADIRPPRLVVRRRGKKKKE